MEDITLARHISDLHSEICLSNHKKPSLSPSPYKLITALCGMRTSQQGAVSLSFMNETAANSEAKGENNMDVPDYFVPGLSPREHSRNTGLSISSSCTSMVLVLTFK